MRAIAIALLAAAASRGLAKCTDDKEWRYDAGDKGNKGCEHVAELPAKRCDRVGSRGYGNGVSARYACCATCAEYDCAAKTKLPIFFRAGRPYKVSQTFKLTRHVMSWKKCEKTCKKVGLSMPCITSEKDDKELQAQFNDGYGTTSYSAWLGYTSGDKDDTKLSNWKWRDGCSSEYTNWYPGQPNSFKRFSCADFDEPEDGYWNQWDSIDCTWGRSCFCQTDDPCALAGKSGGKGGKAPSEGCKKDDKTWRDKDDGTTCKGIKKIKDKKARKKACKKRRGENADGEIVTAKEACCKKACK